MVARQDREGLAQFLVRLCAGIGGLVATSQIVCGLLKTAVDFYCCKREVGKGVSAAAPPHMAKTADLLAPEDRRPPTMASAAATAGEASGVVTLAEAEKLIRPN